MVNYQLGKIYQITSIHTNLVYVGSTCQPLLCKRLTTHIGNFRSWLKDNTQKYMSSYKIIELGDYEIQLIKAFPCDTKDQLKLEEGKIIKERNCVNERIAGRTHAMYHQDHKERIHTRKNRSVLCICGVSCSSANLSAHMKRPSHLKNIENLIS